VEGKRVNGEVIREIARSVPVPVELAGGSENLASIEFYLEAGVEWVSWDRGLQGPNLSKRLAGSSRAM